MKKKKVIWNFYPGLAALTLGYNISPLRGFKMDEKNDGFASIVVPPAAARAGTPQHGVPTKRAYDHFPSSNGFM